MKNSKEKYFISLFSKNSKHIGDDGAVIGKWVYTQDAFFENVHFKKEWLSLKQIAKKAMLINISDAIAMNAVPKYALLTVAIPKSYSKKDLKKISKGFLKCAKKYNISIIGGDTISNEKLDISITLISKTKNPIYRSGAKVGDLMAYSGSLGSVREDLLKLFDGKTIDKNSKFIKPRLRDGFFYEASKYINSSLDISDGLFFELERISKASNIGYEFIDGFDNKIACSGEEYELLFSFEEKNLELIEKIAKKHNVKINIFAKAIKGSFKNTCKEHHF